METYWIVDFCGLVTSFKSFLADLHKQKNYNTKCKLADYLTT